MVAKLFEVSPEVAYGRIKKDAAEKVDRCFVPEHAVYRYYGMYLYTKKVLMQEDLFDVTVDETEGPVIYMNRTKF